MPRSVSLVELNLASIFPGGKIRLRDFQLEATFFPSATRITRKLSDISLRSPVRSRKKQLALICPRG